MNHQYLANLELEEAVCDICRSNEFLEARFKRPDDMVIVECTNCGLAFLNPRPTADSINKLYDSNYFNGTLKEYGIGLTADYLEKLEPLTYPQIEKLINLDFSSLKNKQVLEIGCGKGNALAALKNLGANVVGIEPSEEISKLAIKTFGLNIIVGTFEDTDVSSNQFDLVIATEVIEHVLSPSVFLNKVFKVLKPGGIAILSTPNYGAGKFIGDKWLGFCESFEHIYYFSKESLEKTALNTGFVVNNIESSGLAYPQGDGSKTRQFIKRIPGVMIGVIILRRLQRMYQENNDVAHQLWFSLKKPSSVN